MEHIRGWRSVVIANNQLMGNYIQDAGREAAVLIPLLPKSAKIAERNAVEEDGELFAGSAEPRVEEEAEAKREETRVRETLAERNRSKTVLPLIAYACRAGRRHGNGAAWMLDAIAAINQSQAFVRRAACAFARCRYFPRISKTECGHPVPPHQTASSHDRFCHGHVSFHEQL